MKTNITLLKSKVLFLIALILFLTYPLFGEYAEDSIKIKVGYYNAAYHIMDSSAASIYDDPIIRLISKDQNFELHLNFVGSNDTVNLEGYDIIVIQESIASGSGILKPTGSLGLPNLKVPTLINKSYGWRAGRFLNPPSAGFGKEGNNYIYVDYSNQSHELFNGITFSKSNTISIFKSLANDIGTEGTKSNNYAEQNIISGTTTLLGYPTEADSSVSICYNDIPEGTIIDSDTTKARIMTIGNNFGAMCKNNGKNFTSEGITIWRNALYSLAGLNVPHDLVIVEDDTVITDTTQCEPVFAWPNEIKKGDSAAISVHFANLPCDAISHFIIRPLLSPFDSVTSDWFIQSSQDDSVFFVYFTIPDNIDTGYAELFVIYYDGMNSYEKKVPVTLLINGSSIINVFPEICMVSINDQNKNQITWKETPTELVDSVIIYREGNVTEQFNRIGSTGADMGNTFVDQEADPRQHANSYVITYQFSNGTESSQSWQHKTIHLTMNQGINGSINLSWDNYWGLWVQTYYVYRARKRNAFEKIAELSANNQSFTDLNPPSGRLYYQIGFPAPVNCDTTLLKSASTDNFVVKSNYLEIGETTSVNDLLTENKIEIYPNPVSGNSFKIKFSNTIDLQNAEYTLQGLDGKIYIDNIMNINDTETAIDVSQLNKGMYILKVNIENESLFKKIIIE